MNNSTFTCDDRLIRAMLREELSDVESNSLLGHIEQCRHCQSRVDEIAASSDEWNQASKILAESADEPSYLQSPKISRLGEEPVVWTESMAQQLLAPPTHPEMLGSLGDMKSNGLIGTGGMGVVFKAFDSELNRPVAIKVLAPHLAGSGAARQRFEREARAAAAVVHQHVVPIHNVETERDTPFLVMYYVAGESLQSRVDREGTLELREILRIGMQVASGLAAAHQQGLVHRDIKPSNILLEGGDVERALITDFGLARAADDASLTRSGFHPGTPQYMSPEQACGEAIDQQSDLFSLGSVLYTLCTGRPPFRAETSYGVMRRITDEAPTSIRELNPDIPEWLIMIIDKLMSKLKADRFESASEVHELLETCLHHVQQPTAVSLPSQLTNSMSGPRRPRRFGPLRIMLAVAASMLLVLLLGVVYYIQTDHGAIRVEVLDESLSVTIKGESVIVKKGDDQTLTLRTGEHQLVVKQGDVELFTDSFRIRRGEKLVFKAEFFDGKVILSQQGKELRSKLVPTKQRKPGEGKRASPKSDSEKAGMRRLFTVATPEGIDFKDADIRISDDQSLVLVGKNGEHLLTIDEEQRTAKALPVSGWRGMRFVPGKRLIVTKTWDKAIIRNPDRPLHDAPRIPHQMCEGDWIDPAISPDGKILVTRPKLDHVQFRDMGTLKPLGEPVTPGGHVSRMQFTPDSKYLCTHTKHGLGLWDPRTGKRMAGPFRDGPYIHGLMGEVAYDPVRDRIVTVENFGHEADTAMGSRVVVRPVRADQTEARTIKVPAHTTCVMWADLNHLIISGGRHRNPKELDGYRYGSYPMFLIRLDDDLSEPVELAEHIWYYPVLTLDGRHVIGASNGETLCWKVGQKQPLWRTRGRSKVIKATNDCVLLRGFNRTLKVHAVETGEVLQNWDDKWHKGMATHVHGDRIWLLDEEKIEVWTVVASDDAPEQPQPDANDEPTELSDQPSIRLGSAPFRFGGQISSLEYSDDGKRLLTAGGVWGAAVWNAENGNLVRHFPGVSAWTTADFSRDGRHVALAGYHPASLPIWNVDTGEQVSTLEQGTQAVRFSPDGKRAFTAFKHMLISFDTETGRRLAEFTKPGQGHVMFATPREGTLVAGNSGDDLRVWDWKTGEEVATAKVRGGIHNRKDLVFIPDGKSLIVYGKKFSKTVEIRAARTLEVTRTLKLKYDPVCVNVSRDGRRLAVGTSQGWVHVFDLETGKEVAQWEAHTESHNVSAVALSPDGKRLACGTDMSGEVRIWDVATRKELFPAGEGHSVTVGNIAVLEDGNVITHDYDRRFGRWNPKTGKTTHFWKWPRPLDSPVEWILCPKTQRALCGYDSLFLCTDLTDRKAFINVYDKVRPPTDGGRKKSQVFGNGTRIEALAMSADGRFAAAAHIDDRVVVCNLEKFEHVRNFTLPEVKHTAWSREYSLALSPDGKLLAGASQNKLVLWDVATGKERLLPRNDFDVTGLAFSPDGHTLAIIGGQQVKLWSVKDEHIRRTIVDRDHGTRSVAFSPDNKLLATGGQSNSETVVLWDIVSGRKMRTLRGARGGAGSLAFAPDGQTIYAGAGSSLVLGWKLRSGKVEQSETPEAKNDQPEVFQPTPVPGLRQLDLPNPALDVSPDEKMALIVDEFGGDNIPVGVPRIWSLVTNKELAKLPDLEGFYLRFVPGERPLCVAGDHRRQQIRFWDIKKEAWHGDWIDHDLRAGFKPIFWPIFSPDGKTVSIASLKGEMQFWDLRGDKPTKIKPPVDKPLPRSNAPMPFYERQFSSDGKYCFAIFNAKLYVLDPARATTVAGPFPHQTAEDLGLSWSSVLYNATSETLVTIESSKKIKPATLRFRSVKKNWEPAHSVTVTGKVGSVSFLGPHHVLSGGLGWRETNWGHTAQHLSTIIPIQPGDTPNQVLERDAYTYAFAPDGKQWVAMSTSSVYAGRLGQEETLWKQPLPQVFKDNFYVDYKLSIESPNWVVSQRTKSGRIGFTAHSLKDGRLLLDKSGLKHVVHVKSTIAVGKEIYRYSPATLPEQKSGKGVGKTEDVESEAPPVVVHPWAQTTTRPSMTPSQPQHSTGEKELTKGATSTTEQPKDSTKPNFQPGPYVAAPDKAFLDEKNVKTTTHELWKIVEDPKLPPYEIPIEKWLAPFDPSEDEDASVIRHNTRLRLYYKGMASFSYDDAETSRDNVEFVNDIKEVLEKEHTSSLPKVVQAAIRLLNYKHPYTFLDKLLECTPAIANLENRSLNLTLLAVLTEKAFFRDSPHPAITSAAKSEDEARRGFAIRTLMRGMNIKPEEATRRFKNETKFVRWQIAMGLIDLKRIEAVPALIDLILDVTGDRASYLEKLLHHIAGNGPNPKLGGDQRTRAVARKQWLDWWHSNAKRLSSQQISHGHTFVQNGILVGELDLAGKTLWEVDVRAETNRRFHRAVLHTNGNFVVAEGYGLFPYQRRSNVYEFSNTGAVLWKHQFGRPAAVDFLPDARILVASVNSLQIFDKERIRNTLMPVASDNNFQFFRGKPNGGFAAMGFGAERSRIDDRPFGDLLEFDGAGKLTRTTRVDAGGKTPSTWRVDFLPNEHLLVSRDSDVVELDRDRKIVRTVISDIDFDIKAVQRLPNGNILLGNNDDDAICEYSPKGEKIGETLLPKKFLFVRRR